MVRIRLRRVGKKKQPSFRLVAADRESPRDGRFLEILGFYNPRTQPATIKLKEDRIFHWMSVGAQPSDAAVSIMKVAGTLDRYERFKGGEDIQKLLEEAAAGDATRNIDPTTRREAPVGKPKAKPKAEAPVEESKAEEAPAKEAVAEKAPAEEKAEEPKEEPKAEEAAKDEAPTEEAKADEPVAAEEEKAEEAPAEEKAEKSKEDPKAEEEVKEKAEKPKQEPKAEKAPSKEKAVEEAPAITSSRASIEKLDLPANITTALMEAGFKTVGKLAKQMDTDTQPLLDVNGVGPKALETIEEKLKEFQP